ncbi:MAG: 4Fe-4S dicluster domain-containing protein [Desulfobacteraceae bacterium]|nr:MAG: 4Fe-4S dicluster domain-containing protein [Desulfobacteraceae bacterium]
MNNVYQALAKHLDTQTPGGYPATDSGVEIRILKRLFTPEQADLCAQLVMMPETAQSIADRTGRDINIIAPMLKEMAKKGLIVQVTRPGSETFMLLSFVVGIWEYQVNSLTKELIEDFNEYIPHLIKEQFEQDTKQMRVVPVSKSIHTDMNVMDYEQAEELIRGESKIIVAPCICRQEHTIMGKGCDKPVEACLVFGGGAYIYESRNIGREITPDEAIQILHNGIDKGLVIQPSNSKRPINMCLCCDCCCQILKNLKEYDAPGKIVNSNFYARIEPENCTACEACVDICPMDAVSLDDAHTAVVEEKRCIGCGLCFTRCDFDAISVTAKTEDDLWEPPKNIVETYMNIAKEKGLF